MKLRLLMAFILGPVVALTGFLLLLDIRTLTAVIDEARQSRIAAVELDRVAGFIHELQKERGYSAGFAASGGANFGDALTAQRQATDTSWRRIGQDLPLLESLYPERIGAIRSGMATLPDWRARLDTGRTGAPDIAATYTAIVDQALAAQSAVVERMEVGDLEATARAALYISRAKEAAGLERAAGATGLGNAEFPHAAFNRLIELGAIQFTTLERAAEELGDDAFAQGLLGHESHGRLAGMRQTIRDAMTGLRQPILTADGWFSASTDWIDHLRDVEASLIAEVGSDALATYDASRAERTRVAVASGVVILLVLGFALASFEHLIFRVRRLTTAMRRFTEGEFDVWIPGIRGRDEVGEMAAAVYAFKQETLAMRKAAAEQKADDEAVILSKAQRVVDLLTEGLAALARADLTQRFDQPLDAEYDSIRLDFNTATQRLREVTEAIVETADALRTRAGGLMQSASELGDRTARQVETITATNARVGELSSEIEAYAGNVRGASQLASSAKQNADRSGDVVRSAVEAMDRISSSSLEIGRIISLIEDISFQTNLLALNAGVEAARAGDSGRGFAVVASEVRDLARRSTEAAQEIRSLIDDSRRHVENGVGLVGEAGDALERIFGEIVQVDDTLGHVAEGAVRQAESLRTLAGDIDRLSGLAGENTEMVHATRTAAGDTAEISRRLTELVGDFRLRRDSAHSGPKASGHTLPRAQPAQAG
ncbi:methyl-accepting chemotaxis protein [Roseibacterium sp. SDUM158016]|uniref:methyl-accepting chemotaxis protein n=1 Tax=Roseicyclus sediminis TaxID=2980997 RepID=UPI0021CE1C48|nr:methyl-accepting chemotaxis protein [Roseibacterium sp. SDUM158016]MCU4655203.1 methyl-accepting chemotaxis protein [Roseibacterium sp. SDUM158016]